ncbi:MAG: hypothetical protein OXQ29_13390, partial [Rhodospirillaceae bacterium]|nr:hypothetical protein [Rhodospirillaceae bacterium]
TVPRRSTFVKIYWRDRIPKSLILSEFALAHVEGSKTVAAYARDDLLEERRPVMQAWSDYVMAPGG